MSMPGDLITDGMIINAELDDEYSINSSDSTLTASAETVDELTPLRKQSYLFRKEFLDTYSDNSVKVCYESTSYDTYYDSSSSTLREHSYGSTATLDTFSTVDKKLCTTRSTLPSSALTSHKTGTRQTGSSYALRSSMLTTFAEDVCSERHSTVLSTVFNIIPLLQGTPIFVIPFAFIKGGLYFIPVALALCVFADISSNLLVECLYTTPPRVRYKRRVHNGLYDVATTCLGQFWANMMYSVVIFYLLANNIINVIVFDECFRDLVAKVIPMNVLATTLVYSVIFASILFVKKVSVFVLNVFIGILSLVVATVTAFSVFLSNSSTWVSHYNNIPLVDLKEFPVATSMFMYSLLANPIIPEIEGGMINPQKIGIALHISYGASSVFKILFGIFGALTFALKTEELVAVNILGNGEVARYFMAISLLLCTFSNSSLPYYVLFDKLDKFIESNVSPRFTGDGRLSLVWLILSRTLGVVCTVYIAISLPYYAAFTGVVGAMAGGVVTLVFPFMFHLRLQWIGISMWRKSLEIILLVVGVVLSLVIIYQSILVFATEAYHHHGLIVVKT